MENQVCKVRNAPDVGNGNVSIEENLSKQNAMYVHRYSGWDSEG